VLCPVVVGRVAELSALRTALEAALRGEGNLVCVTGEPGIGKSRLARELAADARARGAAVVVGRAVPGGSTAYRPLTEALLQALRDRPFPTDDDLVPWRPALSAIIPGLTGKPADTPGRLATETGEAPGAGQAGDRADGFGGPAAELGEASAAVRGEAVLRLLRRLAQPGGMAVVLEDLHWADPDTLAVLEYLGDNLASVRVLLLATSRDEPPSAALELIRRLRARRAAVHLAPRRLDAGHMSDMVRACAPGADGEMIARVRDAAEGVPLLIEEVLASPGVPASFRDTVRARLASLAPGQRQVLGAAAVLGRHFDWRLLAAVSGQGPDQVAEALDGGTGVLLLAVDGDEFRFRHALTREAVAESLLPPRRAAVAAAALVAVEDAHPGLPGPWRDVAADLALQSGNSERAGELLAASGGASLERGALATAIGTLQRAAGMLAAGPRRDEARLRLVEALALAGRVDEAMTVGADLIAGLGDGGGTARDRARVHVRLGQAAVAATRWRAASEHLTAAGGLLATGLLAAGPDATLDAQVAVLEAEVALAGGDFALAASLAERALAEEAAGADVRCHALEVLGRTERLRDPGAAQHAFERALALAESAGLPIWRLRALHELGTIELLVHGGTGRLTQALQTATELGALSTVAVLGLQLAAAGDSRFDLGATARHASQSLAISERLGLAQVRAKALLFLAESSALGRKREQTEHYVALCLAAAGDDPAMQAFCWGGCRGMLALLEGDQGAALVEFGRAAAILRSCPHAEPANFRAVYPLVLAATGDGRAQPEIDAAHEAGIVTFFANRGLVGYAEAILAGRAGDAERAVAGAAAAESRLAPFPVWVDLARMYAGEAALADGWGEPRRWLRAARESFASRGINRLAQRCADALGDGGAGRWARLGVTVREADVLRLVAEGLANKQIAERLFLSPRTVEKHIESLLRKTGARSRTQLVAIAGPPDDAGAS
jgi:DNA-binding CsgD family transcriptional regulator